MKKLFILLLFANCLFANVDCSFTRTNFGTPAKHFHKNMLWGLPGEYQNNGQSFLFQQYEHSVKKRSLWAQPFLSLAAGIPSALVLGFIAAAITEKAEYSRSNDVLANGIYGGYLGYLLGNGVGAWQYGKARQGAGSFEGSLMGSILGGFVGIGLTVWTQNGVPLFLGPPIGACISFKLTKD